jgi:amino acid transporter
VFAPHHVFGGGLAVALLFAVLSFAGFEATAIFAEESRRPRRTVAIATFTVVLVMTGLFAVSSWSAIAAFDSGGAAVKASADTGTFFFAIGERYLGAWSVDVLQVLVVLSFLASVVAVHNMAARYAFSLGRGGLLPGWLAQTHYRLRTPHRAGLVQVGITVAVLALFSAAGGEPLTDVVPALAGLFTLVFLVLMTGTSLAVVRAFRTRLPPGSRWSTLVAPLVAAVLLATTTALLVANYSLIAGSDAQVVTLLPWIVFGAAAIATVVGRRSHDVRVP